jgi:hypothetical protein
MAAEDDRYTREVRRRELAIRLIRLKARTSTVIRWTGTSRQKIRTLVRSVAGKSASASRCRRGPAPRDFETFFKTAWMRAEASAAAVLCRVHGVIADRSASVLKPVPTVARGERLCDAYETYLDLVNPARLTFEHFVLLVDELDAGTSLALESCQGCGAALLVEPATLARRRCECCRVTHVPEIFVEDVADVPNAPEPAPAAQGELF